MTDIDELIKLYLNSSDPSIYEELLLLLAAKTNEYNYLSIVEFMENQPNCSELDLAMYILEISCPEFIKLIPAINEKLLVFKDKDAMEDLVEALAIMREE
jgi:hypothetical protein